MNSTARSAAQPHKHIIRMAHGEVIPDLEIQEVYEGSRDRSMFPHEARGQCLGVLDTEGGILFRTARRKDFFIKFSEFSFVVNPTSGTLTRAYS